MTFDDLHEAEDVTFASDKKQACLSLWKILKTSGFTLHEDVFSLDRPKKPPLPIWQSESFVEVSILNDNEEVYESSGEWNKLVLRYLLATQPRQGIPTFAKTAATLSERLGIPMVFHGKPVTIEELEANLNRFAGEVTANLGEPGSEEVAILIRATYPRRK